MIRVRFAPSPTGHLHIGGLRTALFNWLFARHNNGIFLLRIEDTDRERSEKVFEQSILSSLSWTNLLPDESIVIQSSRLEQHVQAVQTLIDQGNAYKCYCTSEEIRKRLARTQENENETLGYDQFCRNRAESNELPYVVRFKVPEDVLTFEDVIRGPITFDLSEFDDFVILRSDGWPTYNLVVVVDDAFMKITHVIRGEDHISNTPKQILLYQALHYALPTFAHLPLILGESGQRLSKRDAATSVLDYQINGYLPDALCNYLVRLGWAHGDQEIFTRDELISLFDLKDINKSGAIFDNKKLLWVNSVYIQQTSSEKLFEYITRDVQPEFQNLLPDWSLTTTLRAIALYQPRVQTLKELADEIILLYQGADTNQVIIEDTQITHLRNLLAVFQSMKSEWNADTIKNILKEFCVGQNIKMSEIAQPLRIILVGKPSAPGIAELLELVGKNNTNERLERLLQNY